MKRISSVSNDHIKDLVKLQNKRYRDERGLFLVEGYHLVKEAHKFLYEVLITDEKDAVNGVENILVSREVIEKISTSKTPQNIIGVCKCLNHRLLEKYNFKDKKILLLDGIQDPGNLGTLIRSSLGFGIDLICASFDTVDIYNEKVIRATQGAIFNIDYIKCDLIDVIKKIKKQSIKVIGTSLESSVGLKRLEKISAYALVLGNEGNGVKKEILKETNINVRIDMDERLESLNVAVAGSNIMFYLYN